MKSWIHALQTLILFSYLGDNTAWETKLATNNAEYLYYKHCSKLFHINVYYNKPLQQWIVLRFTLDWADYCMKVHGWVLDSILI